MIQDKIQRILATLNKLKSNDAVIKNADILTFIISLLPIPGVQQVGQIANKIVTNEDLKNKFNSIKIDILNTNERINILDNQLERIGMIAETVSNVSRLESLVSEFLNNLESDLEKDSEFIVDTSNWSIQVLIKQIVEANFVSISARDFSQNHLRDTQIKSRMTHLSAHNHSSNIIDGTDFKGDSGSVTMNGISQFGNISATDSSVGFHGNSGLIFRSPDILKGNCPSCNTLIQIEKQKLLGYSQIQCPNCKNIYPFNIN
ncbi:hypothetical protein [Paenibacillus durus]|uniref:Uncharacterized protein n=1 Tax=Paenibacillus durus TaxID=44251 RepID=A0A089HVA7_PAEDU|nr:hypothetical protein [Paenibacillus durus]AIQ15017.1 hypothetical protein PDUR_26440 [Paenibacillus durus]